MSDSDFIMHGIIKKKGRHTMQGYKDREFTVDKAGIMKYGAPGNQSKWRKKLKLVDIKEIAPLVVAEPRHSFTITKMDGRILYFAAQNDEEKWKWINGFRQAIRVIREPNVSSLDHADTFSKEVVMIPLLKLSKYSATGMWRWRFFEITEADVIYYGDPALGDELGRFPRVCIEKVSIIKGKHGQDEVIQVDVKNVEKRTYFFSSPIEEDRKKMIEMCKPVSKKGIFGLW